MFLYRFARYRAFALVVLICALLPSMAADWPAFRHDAQRSAVTDEKLAFPLHLAWQYTCAQPPSPAWRPVSKTLNRLEFDYAPQPVIANGIVCFGSSSDDTIRALDAATGALKWQYTTGGPVRFAPQIADGKVYAASDDGYVYCLEATTGKEVWTFRAAPADDRLLGDLRMISRWPLRCGVLVDGGVVYTVAGMWPSEGVFVYALDAVTGKMIWCNDTGGALTPWDLGEPGTRTYFFGNYTGLTPQGPLLAGRDTLVVPMGRALPAGIDRKTGKLLNFRPGMKLTYASAPPFAVADDTAFFYTNASKGSATRGENQQFGTMNMRKGTRATLAFKDLPQPNGMRVPGKGMDVTLLATKDRLYARQGYSVALAGETLLVGEDGAVAAYEAKMTMPAGAVRAEGRPVPYARYDAATQRELWRVPVDGQARGLAVANGRVYVTTDRGLLYCFAATGNVPVRHHADAVHTPPIPHPLADQTLDRLRAVGMDCGYALLFGDAEGTLAVTLATRTRQQIITVASSEVTARTLRARLLATTALHGSRIHVFAMPKDGRLPFAQYFANAVIVAGDTGAVPASELYRLLRPSGGVLFCPGLPTAQARALLKASGASAAEIRDQGEPYAVRGPLSGALDWNSPYASDQRLHAPLRPLWFGGPAPMEFYERTASYPNMTFSSGRFYYLLRGNLVAVDAYNGSELWRRYVPRDLRAITVNGEERLLDTASYQALTGWDRARIAAFRKIPGGIRALNADADSVYLTVNPSCFRGSGVACLQIDAATGAQRAVFGPAVPSQRVLLKAPQTWTIPVDATHEGRIAMSADKVGLTLELTTRDPAVTPGDLWVLYFDFRAASRRYGLYERGTFQVRILPALDGKTSPAWQKGRGEAFPDLSVTGTRAADGTATTVRLSWEQIEALMGARPTSFGFAASLRFSDGEEQTPVKPRESEDADDPDALDEEPGLPVNERFLFCDAHAEALNNGWATIALTEDATDTAHSTVVAGPLENVPAQLLAPRVRRSYYKPNQAVSRAFRIHPLTGDIGPKMYTRGNGCGDIYSAADVNYMRSGTLGFYDLLDDSGIRHFGGVRTSCVDNMLAVFGLLYVTDDGGGCVCQYSFQTPFVLAPAEKRLHEDWATFTDVRVENQVRLAAINLGAPGDRRDENGTLWLNFPRFGSGNNPLITPGGQEALNGLWPKSGTDFAIPLKVETAKGFEPYRMNADRVTIRNTDQPWIYTSQYRGITKATLHVDFRTPLAARSVVQPPMLDGKLDPAWGEQADFTLPNTKTDFFLRHDAAHLYVAARRPATIARGGKPTPWIALKKGEDASVWEDEAIELFLSDARGAVVVHLGVSPAGARYDALVVEGAKAEDAKWNGAWRSAQTADDKALIVEYAVPLATLTAVGLDTASLAINVQANGMYTRALAGEALCHLGGRGRARCVNFMPLGLGTTPTLAPRAFTVRLHFAELDDVKPGERVFDVKLQGQTVLTNFDIAKEAGVRTALVKEFPHVQAGEALMLEFVPKSAELTPTTAPILNAIEVYDEQFRSAP